MNTKIVKIIVLVVISLCGLSMFGQSCNQGDQNKPKQPEGETSTTPERTAGISVFGSSDPNEIIGTKGYDAPGDTLQWVAATATLPYTIYFENDPDFATAAAQRVEVRHKLHPKVSKSTFCVGSFGFGSHVFAVEGEVSSYQTRLDLTEDMGIYVDVVAGYDVVTNEAFWILQTIDPATGVAPISPDMGFLPVNDEEHSGEGFVSFTIKPNERQCVTGDTITAMASIVFDINEAIPTNKWWNTVDALPPTTQLIGQEQRDNTLLLQFSGNDDTGGCGLKQFKLYVSDNYGAYQLYGTYPAGEEATYTPEFGHCYRFFCLGEDNVGNIEAMKEEAEYEYGNYNLVLTVAASPEEGGTVAGGGQFAFGAEVTVTALANSGFTFDHWSYNGNTLSTSPTYTFTMEGSRDLVANFVYTGSAVVTQQICLAPGWNWWSSYVQMTTEDDFGMLKTALADNATMIKSRNDGFVSYYGDWYGTLSLLTNKDMYMINMNSEQEISITGVLANPSEIAITLNPSWNWIGYPTNKTNEINAALANLTAKDNDMLKSRNAFASYYSALGWVGTLTELTPGEGYMYNSTRADAIDFYYGSSKSGQTPKEIRRTNHWEVSVGEYEVNSTIIGVLEIDGQEQRDENLVVGAFIGDRCVGQTNALFVEALDRYLVFLTYFGNEDDEIAFRMYDEANDMEYGDSETTVLFEANSMLGTVDNPFVINFNTMGVDEFGFIQLALFPNPVKKGDKVRIRLSDELSAGTEITVVTSLGVECQKTTVKGNTVELKVPETSGIYMVKITDQRGNVYFGKLIVE